MMRISELMEVLQKVQQDHGDLVVTAHCMDDEITRWTVLNEDSLDEAQGDEDWTATELFLEG